MSAKIGDVITAYEGAQDTEKAAVDAALSANQKAADARSYTVAVGAALKSGLNEIGNSVEVVRPDGSKVEYVFDGSAIGFHTKPLATTDTVVSVDIPPPPGSQTGGSGGGTGGSPANPSVPALTVSPASVSASGGPATLTLTDPSADFLTNVPSPTASAGSLASQTVTDAHTLTASFDPTGLAAGAEVTVTVGTQAVTLKVTA